MSCRIAPGEATCGFAYARGAVPRRGVCRHCAAGPELRRKGYLLTQVCYQLILVRTAGKRGHHATMKAAAMCWLLIMSLGGLSVDSCTAEDIHVTKWESRLPGRTPFPRGVQEYVTSHGADKRESAHPQSMDWSSVPDGKLREADYTRWQEDGRHEPRHVSDGMSWREASGGEDETPRDEMLTSRSADLSARAIRAPFGNKNAWVLYKRRSDNNNNNNNNNNYEDNNSDRYQQGASRIKRFMDKHGGFAVRAKSNAWILYKREEGKPLVLPPPQWVR